MANFTLKRGTIAAYVLPAIPISAIGLPLAVYVAPYYWTHVGVPAALVSSVFLIVRLGDLFFDPVFGFVADHTKTRWGRRRHWLVVTTPILMLAVWMFFLPPDGASWRYMALWVAIVYLCYSVMTIAHGAWGAELSSNYHERSRISGAREFTLVGGMIFVLLLPTILENVWGADAAQKVAAMGWFIVLLLPLTVGIAVTSVGERDVAPHHNIDIKSAWKLLVSNRPLQRILLTDLLFGTATSVTASLYIVLVEHVFHLQQSSTLLLIYFIAGLAGIPLWIRLSYKFGKHKALAAAAVYAALTLPLNLIAPHDGTGFWWLAVANTLYGVAFGAGAFLMRSIMADVVDQETAASGRERMGVYFSFLVMTNKLGYAISILAYPVIEWTGFNAKRGAVNTPEALFGIQLFFILVPAVLFALAAWVMWRFPLDEKKQEELRELIAARAEFRSRGDAEAVPSPVPQTPGTQPGPAPAE